MKRLVYTTGLALVLFVNAFGGWTPNSGYAGCAPGIYWFNDETGESFCCPPGIECPLNRSAYEPPTKTEKFQSILLTLLREMQSIPFLR